MDNVGLDVGVLGMSKLQNQIKDIRILQTQEIEILTKIKTLYMKRKYTYLFMLCMTCITSPVFPVVSRRIESTI